MSASFGYFGSPVGQAGSESRSWTAARSRRGRPNRASLSDTPASARR